MMMVGSSRPADPRAQRRQQLEVAVAHAFLAGDQLERPVHGPQRQVAGDRADDGVAQRHDGAVQVQQQAEPQQRQGEVVRQRLGVVVDQGHRDQEVREHEARQAQPAAAEMPDEQGPTAAR